MESADASDRFLWDFRRTLADLWADAHYGTMADKLREDGIGIYAEAAGVSLEMPEDTLLNKSKVEIRTILITKGNYNDGYARV